MGGGWGSFFPVRLWSHRGMLFGMGSRILDATSVEVRVRTLAALSDPHRLRILDLLGSDERCVCDLQESVAVATNLLSYHLRVLREAGLVVTTRRGRWIDYRMADDASQRVEAALPRALSMHRVT
jgi:ArsR family transcriptional regulator